MSEANHAGLWYAAEWSCDAKTTVLVDDDTAILGKRVVAECGTEADARLIAAAPELLDALHAMVNKATKQNWNDKYPDELAAAFAAITKATGGEQ